MHNRGFMRRALRAVVLAVALTLVASAVAGAFAAEWAEGRSAAQPYSGVPEVDLEKTIGYIMLYPRDKVPVQTYCNALKILLPREDIVAGKGKLQVYAGKGDEKAQVMETVNFEDPQAVNVRAMTEQELRDMMWGGGTCVEIHLPISLRFGMNYYVLMDEGCITAANGKVVSPAIKNPEAWTPILQGDYGVGGVFYSKGVVEISNSGEADLGAEPTPMPTPPAKPEYKFVPTIGDNITLDVQLGGDAKKVVLYSENDSVKFPAAEIAASGTVSGVVTLDDVKCSVIFLDDANQVVDVVEIAK